MWTALGRQLRQPSGTAGVLIGRLMGVVNRRSNRIAIDALAVNPCDTVLELGFGCGSSLNKLAEMAAAGRVLGIDHSATMLSHAARRSGLRAGRAHLLRGRFGALPCRSASIDKILAVHVIYFAGPEVIREAERVLRPGGRLVVLVTERASMKHWKFARTGTHHLFNRDDLAGFLREGGFAAENISVSLTHAGFGVNALLAVATKS